ncbi:MAG: peptidoglycan-binding protein [Lactobacillaceae bacterium]|jgi:peptidoglycan hydrolase-like protein with peptidoglycan-binding domain|nr:peptidoglycan-binding protein [Lactobacillaceae bacterium]
MSENKNLIEVRTHTRDGHRVSSYTRAAPGNGVCLERSIDRASENNPKDTLIIKKILNELGYYEKPEYGMTPIPDEGMFTAVQNFQKDNNLKVDGIIKPLGWAKRAFSSGNKMFVIKQTLDETCREN